MGSGAVGKAVSNIHSTLEKSLDYITNPNKTDKQLLVSGINCYEPENAKITGQDFKEIYNKYSKNNQANKKPILAHHYLVSFDPKDNIDAQRSHELSKKIIDKFLKKEHQAVLSTHVDKEDHIHTHIIFNTYNKNTGKKYESSPEKLREFKKIINEVCLEHDLSLINKRSNEKKSVNLNYKEWLESKNIIDDKKLNRFKYIRGAVKSTLKDKNIDSLDKLKKVLKDKFNLDIIYKNYKSNQLYKNITFKSDDWEKGIRGKYDISLENIIKQLEGKDAKLNRYEEYCIENDTEDSRGYIKEAIDTELKDNPAIINIDDLAKVLKDKYNIQMNYMSYAGSHLKRFKYKALDAEQKNYIGSAKLDKENRENYEVNGIKSRIEKLHEIKFGIDIKQNLEILNKNLLVSGKNDRWGICSGLNYMTKLNLRSKSDIFIRRTKLSTLKDKNQIEVDRIDEYLKQMELTYSRLKKKMIEVKALEKEVSEVGIFGMKPKKELQKKIESINNDINKIKESEYYQKEIKYSEKTERLNEERTNCVSKLKSCENEFDLIYNIETIDKNKESILDKINKDKEQEKELAEEQQREKAFKKSLGIDL